MNPAGADQPVGCMPDGSKAKDYSSNLVDIGEDDTTGSPLISPLTQQTGISGEDCLTSIPNEGSKNNTTPDQSHQSPSAASVGDSSEHEPVWYRLNGNAFHWFGYANAQPRKTVIVMDIHREVVEPYRVADVCFIRSIPKGLKVYVSTTLDNSPDDLALAVTMNSVVSNLEHDTTIELKKNSKLIVVALSNIRLRHHQIHDGRFLDSNCFTYVSPKIEASLEEEDSSSSGKEQDAEIPTLTDSDSSKRGNEDYYYHEEDYQNSYKRRRCYEDGDGYKCKSDSEDSVSD